MASSTYVIRDLYLVQANELQPEHANLGEIGVNIVSDDGTVTLYMSRDHADQIARQISNMVSAIDMANVDADMAALRSAGLLPEWREYGPDGFPVDSDDADYIKFDEAPYSTVGDVARSILTETLEMGDTI